MLEYTAAEAKKHIGERATVVGKVDCIGYGRRHTDVQMGGCDLRKALLWIVVPNEVSGPKLEPGQLRGVTIAVTGKIESSGGTPQITIKSTSQIVPRTPLNPDYFSSAMEKQSRGDLDGAIADLDRVVELTHEPSLYIQRAEAKVKKGDLEGAIRDYDELIQRSADEDPVRRAIEINSRAGLKIKRGDYDGAIADADLALRLAPKLATLFSTRGDAHEAKGEFALAAADYQMAVNNDPPGFMYKDKLKHAQAEAGRKREQSFNKSEVTPESIAQAFVQAYSGADVDALAGLYGDHVHYTNSGVISNAAIRKQAQEYFARWPVRQWSLAGPVKTTSMGPSRQKVIFSASYDASNPQTNKRTSGIATETLIVASDASGAMKIVSQKEQTSKKGSSRSNEETSADPGLKAAKAEYEASSHDEATRVRYVTKLADIYYQSLQNDWATGEKKALEGGDLVFEELTKHPAPADSDSKKLSQLLVGEWAAPRHGNPYLFRADGKWGRSGGPMDESWQIKGNQYFAWDATGKIDDSGTIILLNDDYFIYSDRDHNVTFYARFQKALADAKRIQKQAEAASQQTPPDKVGNVEGAVLASAERAETQEFEAAKQEYEQSTHDESARSAYVTKLAKIRHRQIQNYWKTGGKNFDSATTVNEELRKHPAPANSDSKKMSQFLIGTWQSPRHAYVFRVNGKYGMEDGPISSNWRIKGNQLIEGSSSGTIILLNADYFIYSEGEAVFFHSRVK